ncbi:hypothetical protein GLAREA_06311 [Glarea lozoyensis ATCC 20868]|uniref:Uncharacterized protein n=1 Tax=Glarea lozoyensis (strain ATCC 20868 / MF5171) TaxID=1116229 RepID=S3D873_GLAL2|nr:uncharacterized protein GLAREA_06311 [Glarea lozoyensis ATCC 20868]EPE33299.1 hypothetical protein GLAREA_06311 [Glarea lozoyensis ATCC 20868]
MSNSRFSRRSDGEAITINTALPSPFHESNAPWRPQPPPSRRSSQRTSRHQSVDGDTWRTSHFVDLSPVQQPPRIEEIGPDTWRTSHEISRPTSAVSAIDMPPLRNSHPNSNLRAEMEQLRTTPPSPLSRASRTEPPRTTPPSPLSRTSILEDHRVPPTPPPRNARRGEDIVPPLTPVTPLFRMSPQRRPSRPDIHDPSRPPHSRHNSENIRHIRRISSSHARNLSESYGLLQSPQDFASPGERGWRYEYPAREKRKIPAWAGVPQSLEAEKGERWRAWLWDGLAVLVTVPFFVVVAAVMGMDGKVVESERLRELCDIASTLLPLTFSLLVGRLFVKLASYHLEQGTTLGLLERLIGSRTVFSTIETQLRFGVFSFLSLGLVGLWLLSPFGSQASLRMLSTALVSQEQNSNVTFFNTWQPTFAGKTEFESGWFASFATLFSAAILAPVVVKTGTQDLWGNVKIPLLSSLSNLSPDKDGYHHIPETFTPTYSSLFGIPTSDIPVGNITFSIESTYLELVCSNITTSPARDSRTFINPGLIATTGPFRSGLNITDRTSYAMGYLGQDMTAFLQDQAVGGEVCLDCIGNNYTSSKQIPGLFLWQDFSGETNVTSIFCVPSQAYVESKVVCNTTSTTRSCRVAAQRQSILAANPSALTLLGFQSVTDGLSRLLPQSVRMMDGVDTLLNYLVSPNDDTFIQQTKTPRSIANTTGVASGTDARVLGVELQDFSTRLSQIVNTFLEGSLLDFPSFVTGKEMPSAEAATSPEVLLAAIRNRKPSITVPATITSFVLTYVCVWAWAAIFILATAMMLIAVIVTVIIRRKTLARDYLPYVSSLVRESQFVTMPRGGVRMDGMTRAKEMRDLKVRLGDVGDVGAGWEIGTGVAVSVGQLAVADWGGVKGEKGGVVKGKLYM